MKHRKFYGLKNVSIKNYLLRILPPKRFTEGGGRDGVTPSDRRIRNATTAAASAVLHHVREKHRRVKYYNSVFTRYIISKHYLDE